MHEFVLVSKLRCENTLEQFLDVAMLARRNVLNVLEDSNKARDSL